MEPKPAVQFLQRFTRQVQNTLSNVDVDHQTDITQTLQTVLYLTNKNCPKPPVSSILDELESLSISQMRAHFLKAHYVKMLEFFCNKFSVEWMSGLPKSDLGVKLVEGVFLSGPPHLAVIVLGENISKSSPGYKLNKCTELLEKLIHDGLVDILWSQCQVTIAQSVEKQLWPTLVTILATLPDRVTAKQGKQASSFFFPSEYISIMCRTFYETLTKVHNALQQGNSCSVEFLGMLMGKLAITGHADALWDGLLPILEPDLNKNMLWGRLCERLVSHVADRCLESLLGPVLMKASSYQVIVKLLGHAVTSNHKLRFLLTNKFILLRFHRQSKILQNIIGYLSHSAVTKPLLIQLLTMILEVWGDGSAVRHTSHEQHLYLSKALITCLAFLNDTDKTQLRKVLIPKLMSGMPSHLESAIPSVRHLGMVVAEAVTSTLDPDGEKLKFEYEDDDETKELKELLVKPTDPGPCYTGPHKTNETALNDKKKTAAERPPPLLPPTTAMRGDDGDEEDLDSDDDFEPYDLSDDVPSKRVKTPVYLRDCMEGLISSDDPDRLEVCLQVAESLVYKQAGSVREIAVEFAKVLLHVQDNACIPGFLGARHRALVALAVVAPIEVADYLTQEFFGRNYNTRQRMDILEVLGAAAQKLSIPSEFGNHGNIIMSQSAPLIQEVNPERSEPQSWQEIVERRIAAKTRRFAHGPKKDPLAMVENKFAAVAGHFFFPLLRIFERRDGVLDLLGSDHLLLSRIVYTLGVVIYAALHAPIVRQMSKALLELTWSLRYHPEPSVRQAILFSVTMTMMAVPAHMLFDDLQSEIIDTKGWLTEVVEKDSDTDCQKMAVHSLIYMDKVVKQEFHQGT